MSDKIRFVVCSYLNDDPDRVKKLYGCVYSLVVQTHKNIEIYIHHDGPLNDTSIPDKIRAIDDRVVFLDNLERVYRWGFPHRRPTALIEPHADWIVFTNDDNYYLPKFCEIMLNTAFENNAGMVYCDMLHTDCNTPITTHMSTYPSPGWIDMGSFMTRTDIIEKTEWDNMDEPIADGIYAQKISQTTNSVKAPGILYIHN